MVPNLVWSTDIDALRELALTLAETRDVEVLKKPFGVDEFCGAVDRLLTSPGGYAVRRRASVTPELSGFRRQ